MSFTLSPANKIPVKREDAAPRALPTSPVAPPEGAAPKAEPAPESKRAVAPVASASLTMSFQVGSAQDGLTVRLTDSVSGQVVREIKLESAATPDGAKSAPQGQIVDLRV